MKTLIILMLICSGTLFFTGCHPAVDYSACLSECETKTDEAFEAHQRCQTNAWTVHQRALELCSALETHDARVGCSMAADHNYTVALKKCDSIYYEVRKNLIGCSARCLKTDVKDTKKE